MFRDVGRELLKEERAREEERDETRREKRAERQETRESRKVSRESWVRESDGWITSFPRFDICFAAMLLFRSNFWSTPKKTVRIEGFVRSQCGSETFVKFAEGSAGCPGDAASSATSLAQFV